MSLMATFDASRMLSFDLETTSANPREARVVTSALVRIDGSEVDANETLADPGVEIPEEAAKVHGITTENAPYDLTVLRQLTGDFTVTGPVFDPLLIDRAKDRYRKGPRNLTSMCEHYGVRLDNAHEATADAFAAARVAWMQVRKLYPDLAQMDTGELMEYQAVQYFTLQEDRKRYFESQGRDASNVLPGWPMLG